MQAFDLIVIGSGSGLDVANAAAQHGLKVAIVEKDRMGGTCLNRGCIPSKLLIHSADVAEIIKRAGLFGIRVNGFDVDFGKIVSRTTKIVDSDSDRISKAFGKIQNPKLFPAECKFVGEKKISVAGKIITADKILIASGTRPFVPKIKGLDKTGYITSDEALRLKKQPKSLTIIGGGFIAAELGHFFGALGTKVNIIQRNKMLVADEDKDVAGKFTEIFSKKYSVYLDHVATSVEKRNGGKTFHVTAENKDTGKSIVIKSEQLLVATGRMPNSDILQVDATGVKTDKKGFIIVDEFLETSVKGIFALGDVLGRYQFKHSANLEAQYAFSNMIYPDRKTAVNYSAMPHAIFSSPQIACVGYTEQELHDRHIAFGKSIYHYRDTAMGEAIGDHDGFVKFLVDRKSGKILGCHIIGSEASILIHEVLVAMKSGDGNIGSIARTVHIHPALSEVVARAAYSFE